MMTLSKYRAGHEIRTRDIQLGKLVHNTGNLNVSVGCVGNNPAMAGPGRLHPARPGWANGWVTFKHFVAVWGAS